MPLERGDARVERFNGGTRDVPVSDKRHGVRVARLPFQLTGQRAITSPEDPTEKRGWRGGRSRFLHTLCLYNNAATFMLNGIVLAACPPTAVVPRSAGQHAAHPLHLGDDQRKLRLPCDSLIRGHWPAARMERERDAACLRISGDGGLIGGAVCDGDEHILRRAVAGHDVKECVYRYRLIEDVLNPKRVS